jgi:hypothetical protein
MNGPTGDLEILSTIWRPFASAKSWKPTFSLSSILIDEESQKKVAFPGKIFQNLYEIPVERFSGIAYK